MIVKKKEFFGLTPVEITKIQNSLAEGAYYERRLGRIKSSDLFENTIHAFSDIHFED